MSPRELLWVREWRQKSPFHHPETPAPEPPPRKTAPSATTGGKPGVGPFPPPDSPSLKTPPAFHLQRPPHPCLGRDPKVAGSIFHLQEVTSLRKKARARTGEYVAKALHFEKGARGPGPESAELKSPSLRRKSEMGTPGCRSAGTHLVHGGEIHGGAEGRSAVHPAESRRAGVRLPPAGAAGAFMRRGGGGATRGRGHEGRFPDASPQHSLPGLGLTGPLPPGPKPGCA